MDKTYTEEREAFVTKNQVDIDVHASKGVLRLRKFEKLVWWKIILMNLCNILKIIVKAYSISSNLSVSLNFVQNLFQMESW